MKLNNHFLIAMPSFARNTLFDRSVIYITEHSLINGTIGVIINKPLNNNFKTIFLELDILQQDVQSLYLGGAIQFENSFVLDSKNQLVMLNNSLDKHSSNVFVGYSAWKTFQIEREIAKNNWLVAPGELDLIHETQATNRYSEALKLIGINNLSSLHYGLSFA